MTLALEQISSFLHYNNLHDTSLMVTQSARLSRERESWQRLNLPGATALLDGLWTRQLRPLRELSSLPHQNVAFLLHMLLRELILTWNSEDLG
jgi:hypothetical protein